MNYIKRADINSATIRHKGKNFVVDVKDFINGIYKMEKGGTLSEYKYIPKRDIVSFDTKKGIIKNNLNGIYIKRSVLDSLKQKPTPKTKKIKTATTTSKSNVIGLSIKPSEKFKTNNEDLKLLFENLEKAKKAKDDKASKSVINQYLNFVDEIVTVVLREYPELSPEVAYALFWYNSNVSKLYRYNYVFDFDRANEILINDYIKLFKQVDFKAPVIKRINDMNVLQSKDLQKLLGSFAGRDDLRPVMTGTSLDKGYAVSTNAHFLLAIYDSKLKNKNEVVCFSDFCKKRYGTKVDGVYPNWRSVIPVASSFKTKKIDALGLYHILSKIDKYQIYNPVTKIVKIKIEDEMIGLNVGLFYQCLEAIMKLNGKDLYIYYRQPNQPILLTSNKNFYFSQNSKDNFALCMPVMITNDPYIPLTLDLNGKIIN